MRAVVRTLDLTLRAQDDWLPLPYVSRVSVPAGRSGAAGVWHLIRWQITDSTEGGIVHRLRLADYPTDDDAAIWRGLTAR